MGTLKKELTIEGNTLMKNLDCKVLIKPSSSGKIKFYVKDSNDQNWIITNGSNSNLTTANVLIKT